MKPNKDHKKLKSERKKMAIRHLSGPQSQNKKISKLCRKLQACGKSTFISSVQIRKIGDSVFFYGVVSCGSVWMCPECSAKKSEQRRHEMNHMLEICHRNQWPNYMLTLTLPHERDMSLKSLLDKVKSASKCMRQNRNYRKFRTEFTKGTVTATEVTIGSNGWHPHLHILFACEPHTEINCTANLQPLWLKALNKQGVIGNEYSFHIQDASYIGSYITKFGAADKMALTRGQRIEDTSRTPLQLLDFNDDASKALFREFALCCWDKRQLVWSPRFKKLVGLSNMNQKPEAEMLFEMEAHEYKKIMRVTGGDTRIIIDIAKEHGKDTLAQLRQKFCL